MKKTVWTRSFGYSGNLKSKTCPEISRRIENPKWLRLWVIAFVLVVTGVAADAQQQAKIPRLGYLTGGDSSPNEAFVQGLRDLGYFEDKNITIEVRNADGAMDRLPHLAAQLVNLKVNVIVAVGGEAALPAKHATSTIPIVFTLVRILSEPD